MDRPLDVAVVRQRARRRWIAGVAGAALALVAFTWTPRLLRPSVERARIRTAVVDTGPLEAALSASGRVLPEVEQVLTSPVDARVLRVRRRAGDPVERGEAIVDLDLGQAELALATLDRDLALKRNEERRTRLALDSSLNDVEGRYESKRLELDVRRTQLERKRQLGEAGLVPVQELKEAELAEAQAEIELRQLGEARRLARESSATEIEGLALEVANLRSRRAEAWRELQRGSARAAYDGVVTWTLTEEGSTVREGDPVARLADLSAFRVEGTISDLNAPHLALGLPARVTIDREELRGRISAVDPTVRDGVVTFTVSLEEKSHPALRPNLRVDVFVLTEQRGQALRLARGPFAAGEGVQSLFVVSGGSAERRRVRLGVASPTHFEVLEGLSEGDEVIVSDMSDYLHARWLRVR